MLGDVFITTAAEQFNVVRNKITRNQIRRWHILNKYDNFFLYISPFNCRDNILARVVNSLVESINIRIKLLKTVVVLLDADLMNIMKNYSHKNMEELLQYIVGQLVENLQKQRMVLHDRAVRKEQPKILLVKLLPVANLGVELQEPCRNKESLQQSTRKYSSPV